MRRTVFTLMIGLTFLGLTLLSLTIRAQKVSFSGDRVSLSSFFSSVTKQTGYLFFYDASLLNNSKRVSIQLNKIPLDSAMQIVMKDLPYSFSIQGQTIFITRRSENSSEETKSHNGLSKIYGLVTDESGLPIVNASVSIAGSKNSVITNEKGQFQIEGKKDDSLEITSIGYRKKVVTANDPQLTIFLQQETSPLEQVIIGGNMFARKRKSDISSVTVIDSKTLQQFPQTDVSTIYRGYVPGTNTYSLNDQPQEYPSLTIRGAGNETSLTKVNVYVDGIEWAGGSGYLSSINKENIDRIEVLRGPESSTLYGTGSNGGIVQMFTKKASPENNDLTFRASAGFINSIWASSPVFQQYYAFNKTIGFKNSAITAGGTYQTNGAWLPGGGQKTGTAYLAFKWNLSKKLTADISSYYAGSNLGTSKIPVYDTITNLSDSVRLYWGLQSRKRTNKETKVHSYFAGLNFSYQLSPRWVHRLTVGYSQNDNHETPISNPDDSGLNPDNFYQSVNRTTTLRYSNLLNLGNKDEGLSLDLMTGADYKNLYYSSRITGSRLFIRDNDPANNNVGVFMQANPSYKNVYLTLALRYDYNKLFKNNYSLNPRIGLTTNFDISTLIIKPRISWGSGITAPSYRARYGYPPDDGFSYGVPNPDIKPQQQSGYDFGLEFFSRNGLFSGEITYYDNVLNDIFVDTELPQDPNGLYVFQTTNLGSIANKGWEFSGRYNLNPRFSAYATFSIMNSTLKDTTGGYLSFQFAGKPPGYPLRGLAKHTAGLFVNYSFFKLFRKKDNGSISLNITEVDGIGQANTYQWILDLAHQRIPDNGVFLPDQYWVTSGTIFRIGLSLEYAISPRINLIAQGNNILNQNNLELIAFNAYHGASWLFGFKLRY